VRSCEAACANTLLSESLDGLIVGPGPGRPEDAGSIVDIIDSLKTRCPILGICLGHQAIALAFGGSLSLHEPMHGRCSPIHHQRKGLFATLPENVEMTRYHSLVVCPTTLPECLSVTAWSPDHAIMGLQHASLPIFGVQFHPESVLSGQHGLALLAQFVQQVRISTDTSSEDVRREKAPVWQRPTTKGVQDGASPRRPPTQDGPYR
jgi:anthranilate synthase/aminodeoxychorismate synthase-like glutamine amidotransferase